MVWVFNTSTLSSKKEKNIYENPIWKRKTENMMQPQNTCFQTNPMKQSSMALDATARPNKSASAASPEIDIY